MNYKKDGFVIRTVIYCVFSGLIFIIFTILGKGMNVSVLLNYVEMDYSSLVLSQISNTLIVLSLTSILSEDFGQLYWIDIKETKLVKPFWSCFVGITVYLLSGVVYSLFMLFSQCEEGIVVSFIISTLLLLLLTYKMISVYFGREESKKNLSVEYKYLTIMSSIYYPSDVYKKLKTFLDEISKYNFRGKRKWFSKIKKQIKMIDRKWNRDLNMDESNDFINWSIKNQDDYREKINRINEKIEEYTRNAISANKADLIKENIELLIENGNYKLLFELFMDLFEWNRKYACVILTRLCKKKLFIINEDKLNFYKHFVLKKLIVESGEISAIQDILSVYDEKNKGMKNISSQINSIIEKIINITEEIYKVESMTSEIEKETGFDRELMKKKKKLKNDLIEDEKAIIQQWYTIMKDATPKDLRLYYVPAKELLYALIDKDYEVVRAYIDIIILNYTDDYFNIKMNSGLMSINNDIKVEYEFSYFTEEEYECIKEFVNRDKESNVVDEEIKNKLLNMRRTIIRN